MHPHLDATKVAQGGFSPAETRLHDLQQTITRLNGELERKRLSVVRKNIRMQEVHLLNHDINMLTAEIEQLEESAEEVKAIIHTQQSDEQAA